MSEQALSDDDAIDWRAYWREWVQIAASKGMANATELGEIAERWESLPEPIRVGILAMIRTTDQKG